MAVDASIPLSGIQFQTMPPGQAMALKDLSLQTQLHGVQLQEAKEEYQAQQKIKALSQVPGMLDPKTGFWSDQGLVNLGSISPQYAQKASQQKQTGLMQLNQIRQANIQEQVNLGLIDKRENEQRDKVTNELVEIWVNTFDQSKKAGANDEVATKNAEKAFQDELRTRKEAGALQFMKTNEYETALGRKRDITTMRSKLPREQLKAEEKQASEEAAKEETPFMKELKARGVKPGSKEWNDELKKHATNQEGLTINLGPAMTPGGIESAAAQAATGQPLTQVVPGYGNAAAAKREQVRQAAIDQIKKDNPGMTQAQAGQELANRSTDYVAGRRSVTQLNTMLGATKQAVSQLEFNIGKTKEVMSQLPGSNLSPIINAIIRGEEKWTGDPKYSSLFYYMSATAQESARILQGGQASVAQLHAGAAEEAKKWANMNMTPASFDEVGKAMLDEGRFRLKSYEDAIRSQKSGGGPMPEPPQTQAPQQLPPTNAQGWKLHQDAQGRKAYVSPDGKQFEVPKSKSSGPKEFKDHPGFTYEKIE